MSDYKDYLESLEMPDAIRERFEHALSFYRDKVGLKVDLVHVTDRQDEEGNRLFESAWFFGGDIAMEAHSFVSRDNFDAAVVDEIAYWRVDVEDYDFEKATDDSRVVLTYNAGQTSGSLTATGANCDSLNEVLQKFVIPRTTL